MKCNFAKTVLDHSEKFKDKVAYYDNSGTTTYGEFGNKVLIIAGFLNKEKIKEKDCVIIIMEDCVDWAASFMACLYIGAVPLPVSPLVPVEILKDLVDFADCKIIIAGNNICNKIKSLSVPVVSRLELKGESKYDQSAVLVHPDSPGYMALSSGTTGSPKIAVHRHQVFYEALKIGSWMSHMDARSIVLCIPKMSWGYGLHASITVPLGLGASAILISEIPSPSIISLYANRFNPNVILTSPAIIKKILGPAGKKFKLPTSVETIISRSEDLPIEHYEEFYLKYRHKIETQIGMLEVANIAYCGTKSNDPAPGTIGKPFESVKIKIINDKGITCNVNEVGEIHVASPLNAMYYYKNYEKTKETFLGEWVKTGDYGYVNNDNNLVFVGRANDIFKVGELIVSPIEIENQLVKSNLVEQIAVTGIINSKGTLEIHAFLVINNSYTLEKFKSFAVKMLMPHQRPSHIHTVDKLPETVTGKKDRKALVQLVKI